MAFVGLGLLVLAIAFPAIALFLRERVKTGNDETRKIWLEWQPPKSASAWEPKSTSSRTCQARTDGKGHEQRDGAQL